LVSAGRRVLFPRVHPPVGFMPGGRSGVDRSGSVPSSCATPPAWQLPQFPRHDVQSAAVAGAPSEHKQPATGISTAAAKILPTPAITHPVWSPRSATPAPHPRAAALHTLRGKWGISVRFVAICVVLVFPTCSAPSPRAARPSLLLTQRTVVTPLWRANVSPHHRVLASVWS